ncbi:hypothetical protein B0T36_07015 [Nocardia donostiensis]|nr:hypothetical protein B0T36_07015 [Nocardia donostiensis]
MTALLIIVVTVAVVIVCAAAVLMYQRRAVSRARTVSSSAPADPFADTDSDAIRGNPRTLAAGDLVDIFGVTYTVRGSLRLSEGGYDWSEHLLDTGDDEQAWLSVEEDPDLELVLWKPAADAPEPGGPELRYAQQVFRRQESGTARYRSEATTGLSAQGTVTYHDYSADDDTRLSFEDYGSTGRYEAALGQVLNRSALMIYPRQQP